MGKAAGQKEQENVGQESKDQIRSINIPAAYVGIPWGQDNSPYPEQESHELEYTDECVMFDKASVQISLENGSSDEIFLGQL